MNDRFEYIPRKLPYDLPEESLEALRERIHRNTTANPEPASDSEHAAKSRALHRVGLTAAAACIVACVAAAFFAERSRPPATEPQPGIEQLLETASDETVLQAAATNYDDIFNNPQL